MTAKNGVSLMNYLTEIDDPRKPSNGMLHDFREILVIAIAAVLSDCDTVEDIAFWAKAKEAWLRRFLTLKNGVPSEDTFLRILRALDPKQFEQAFRRWVGGIVGALGGTLAIDGKTVRGSASDAVPAIHMVSAYATELGLVLGQEKVAAKSNEITAIPELLAALDLRGWLVSIDAMGCQKTIAEQIVTGKGDYLLAVKGNQQRLHAAIETAFIACHGRGELATTGQAEKSHGRVVGQTAAVLPAQGIVDAADWPRCAMIGRIDSLRIVGGKASDLERRYYISSRVLTASELATATRAHWGIENKLHWVLDVTMGEDASQLRRDNAPQNLSLLRKIALNILRAAPPPPRKTSLRLRRKGAAWDDDLRMGLLGITAL